MIYIFISGRIFVMTALRINFDDAAYDPPLHNCESGALNMPNSTTCSDTISSIVPAKRGPPDSRI